METENNQKQSIFAEIGKFFVCIFIGLIALYIISFISTNAVINTITAEKQDQIENKLENLPNIHVFDIVETNPKKLVKIKNKIISKDKSLSKAIEQKISYF